MEVPPPRTGNVVLLLGVTSTSALRLPVTVENADMDFEGLRGVFAVSKVMGVSKLLGGPWGVGVAFAETFAVDFEDLACWVAFWALRRSLKVAFTVTAFGAVFEGVRTAFAVLGVFTAFGAVCDGLGVGVAFTDTAFGAAFGAVFEGARTAFAALGVFEEAVFDGLGDNLVERRPISSVADIFLAKARSFLLWICRNSVELAIAIVAISFGSTCIPASDIDWLKDLTPASASLARVPFLEQSLAFLLLAGFKYQPHHSGPSLS